MSYYYGRCTYCRRKRTGRGRVYLVYVLCLLYYLTLDPLRPPGLNSSIMIEEARRALRRLPSDAAWEGGGGVASAPGLLFPTSCTYTLV